MVKFTFFSSSPSRSSSGGGGASFSSSTSSSWQWPSCTGNQSFRSKPSVPVLEPAAVATSPLLPELPESISLRKSDRLIFEPEPASLVAGRRSGEPFGGSRAMSIESDDPYADFRRSMAEMVTAHGAEEDWEWLEEMLGWYLRANVRKTHSVIVGAFVDLLVALSAPDGGVDADAAGRGDGVEMDKGKGRRRKRAACLLLN